MNNDIQPYKKKDKNNGISTRPNTRHTSTNGRMGGQKKPLKELRVSN